MGQSDGLVFHWLKNAVNSVFDNSVSTPTLSVMLQCTLGNRTRWTVYCNTSLLCPAGNVEMVGVRLSVFSASRH